MTLRLAIGIILIFPTMYTIIGIISAEEHHKDENAP